MILINHETYVDYFSHSASETLDQWKNFEKNKPEIIRPNRENREKRDQVRLCTQFYRAHP